MIEILYKPKFIKQFDDLESPLQKEVLEKIELLKDTRNHKKLKVHKLHGHLRKYFSFSVNYRFRIVFDYVSRNKVALLVIGDHDIYK